MKIINIERIKKRARGTIYDSIRRGKIKKSVCEVCGNPMVEAHHNDYSKPREIKWLCGQHHQDAHSKMLMAGHALYKNSKRTSKFKGVRWNKWKKIWRAQIYINGETHFIKECKSEIEAAKAYDETALKAIGSGVFLNFPIQKEEGK